MTPSCRTRSSFACSGIRHVADLVEEERAAVGELELAGAVAVRAGEGAAGVAEELALEQLGRDRRAVERDEERSRRGLRSWMARATSSLPVPVSPVISTLLFVGATRRMSSKTACIGGRAADQVLEGRASAPLLAEVAVLRAVAAHVERVADDDLDGLEVEGLQHEVEGAVLHRLDGRLDRAVGGQHDHRHLGVELAHACRGGRSRWRRACAGRSARDRSAPARSARAPPRRCRRPSIRGPSARAASAGRGASCARRPPPGPSSCRSLRRRQLDPERRPAAHRALDRHASPDVPARRARTKARPRPVPPSRREKNGVKMRSRSSAGMPGPSSTTSNPTRPSFRAHGAHRRRGAPAGRTWSAFTTQVERDLVDLLGVAERQRQGRSRSRRMTICFSRACPSTKSSARASTVPSRVGSIDGSRGRPSSSSPATTRSSRSTSPTIMSTSSLARGSSAARARAEHLRRAAHDAERRAHLVREAGGDLADERELGRHEQVVLRARSALAMALKAVASFPISSRERTATGRGTSPARAISCVARVSSRSGRLRRPAHAVAIASAPTSTSASAAAMRRRMGRRARAPRARGCIATASHPSSASPRSQPASARPARASSDVPARSVRRAGRAIASAPPSASLAGRRSSRPGSDRHTGAVDHQQIDRETVRRRDRGGPRSHRVSTSRRAEQRPDDGPESGSGIGTRARAPPTVVAGRHPRTRGRRGRVAPASPAARTPISRGRSTRRSGRRGRRTRIEIRGTRRSGVQEARDALVDVADDHLAHHVLVGPAPELPCCASATASARSSSGVVGDLGELVSDGGSRPATRRVGDHRESAAGTTVSRNAKSSSLPRSERTRTGHRFLRVPVWSRSRCRSPRSVRQMQRSGPGGQAKPARAAARSRVLALGAARPRARATTPVQAGDDGARRRRRPPLGPPHLHAGPGRPHRRHRPHARRLLEPQPRPRRGAPRPSGSTT